MPTNFIERKYSVIFDEYSKKCFIKDFQKKHKGNWPVTERSIIESLERIANLSKTEHLDVICRSNKETFIAKYDFKIAGTKKSSKKSGDRCILEICNETFCVKVLLVYGKNHISRSKGQETLWWKGIIGSVFDLCCSAKQ